MEQIGNNLEESKICLYRYWPRFFISRLAQRIYKLNIVSCTTTTYYLLPTIHLYATDISFKRKRFPYQLQQQIATVSRSIYKLVCSKHFRTADLPTINNALIDPSYIYIYKPLHFNRTYKYIHKTIKTISPSKVIIRPLSFSFYTTSFFSNCSYF